MDTAPMKAESERRIALMDALPDKPAAANATDSTSHGEPEPSPTKDSAPQSPPSADNPAKAPTVTTTSDLTFVPEKYRSSAEKLDPEFLNYLRTEYGEEQGKLRFSNFTQKTQALAAEKKSVEDRKVALDFGEAVMSDPEALEALRALAAKREGPTTTSTSTTFDYTEPHTPEEWQEHMTALRKQAAADALAALKAEQESVQKSMAAVVSDKREQALAAKAALVDSGEYTVAEVDDLYAALQADGVQFSKDNVVGTLRKYLPKKEAKKPQDSPPPNGTTRNGTSGASALTRWSGVTPPLHIPAFLQSGRAPATREERLQEAIYEVNARRVARGLPPLTGP